MDIENDPVGDYINKYKGVNKIKRLLFIASTRSDPVKKK
jgi:hypothetical protein